ncbi:MAG: aspartyl/asparaginyl beta-hydroxylase domain-containing protein [Roseivirga sp.]|nr:aspartyl/asparaginyl beta-hydroxylase domain-containing protein [Roseivirga sp.]
MIEINHHKTESIRNLGDVDITEITGMLNNLNPDDWDKQVDFKTNYNKKKGGHSALQQVQHITFRFSNKQSDEIEYLELPSWKAWESALLPLLQEATALYGYKNGFYPKVMLAKIPAKGFIPPHVDGGIRGFAPHKIHIPIQTNPDCFFFIEKEKHNLKEGVAYEVNNGKQHGVVNNGTTDRIHLIFEYLDMNVQPEEVKNKMRHCQIQSSRHINPTGL